MRYALLSFVLLVGCRSTALHEEQSGSALPSIDSATNGLRAVPGYAPLWWDESEDRALLELPREGEEFLYWVSLPRGLGSNDVGLDRGQLGGQWLLRTVRAGSRALLVAPSQDWRSSSADVAVARAVEESFAESVIFGFDIEAETEGRLLVDATDFFLRDTHRIAASLASSNQGSFSLDVSRSALLGEELRGFPDNSQAEALLTFVTDRPGGEVFATAPDARSISLRIRHNFMRLPDEGYRPRRFHPASGYFPLSWTDLSAGLDERMTREVVTRHRLQRVEPGVDGSPVVEPIVYYIDRGAPEPVRTALLEGARYWQDVFAKAGFPDGFRAELLPEGADPHDARYNVVQWVNRSTRGWSYGMTVTDPRTGEILKGHVTLGALRVRQDVLLAEGLLSPYADGDDLRAIELALARLRQLAAHEIGHTLGLAHNFAASTNGRASVMDYPAPLVRIDAAGQLDLSEAYRDGCGEWDELAIRYGYSDFDAVAGGEGAGLLAVIEEARERGLNYMSDRDARGSDRAHPLANLWDNGSDPVDFLAHELKVRRIGLAQFGEGALREGRPLAELEELLVPLFLHHRYQLEAAVRSIGGVEYEYELRDAGAPRGVRPVPAERQRRALELALRTLAPDFLALPESIRRLIPPRAPGSPSHRELASEGSLLLDPARLAAASIENTLEFLFDPERAARLADQARRDPEQLDWKTVVKLVSLTASSEVAAPSRSAHEALREAVLEHLMRLAGDVSLPIRVRAPAHAELLEFAKSFGPNSLEAATVARFLLDPELELSKLRPARIPPGSPIGCGFDG